MSNLLSRLQSGKIILPDEPIYERIHEIVSENMDLLHRLNTENLNMVEQRRLLGQITGHPISNTVTVLRPFHTDFGRHIQFGENVFVNADVNMTDLGGIILEDHVLIGPKVILATVNHLEKPQDRRGLSAQPIRVKVNAWVGAGAIILPGVTIGKNAIISAGAVVTKDVPDNTIVAGVPAKIMRKIEQSGKMIREDN